MRNPACPLRSTLSVLAAGAITLGVLMVPALPTALARVRAGSAVTVRGPRLVNPATINPTTGAARLFRAHSTVTVGQADGLVNQAVRVSWTEFTPTSPGTIPYASTNTGYPVAIAECRVARPRSEDQCFGLKGRSGTPGGQNRYGPYNIVFATTGHGGRGTASIALQTGAQNSWLGCGPAHACSLAVIPVQGGDILNTPFSCASHLEDAIFAGNTATAGITFGPPAPHAPRCSWRDRVTIPLRFARGPASCPRHRADFTAVGSPMLARAMSGWDARLCAAAGPLRVSYNATVSEPQAIKTVRAGRADVALTARPAASLVAGRRRYTYAPVAVSAVSVPYWVDNAQTGEPFTQLRLTPRLAAKMVTTSYDLADIGCSPPPKYPDCDPGVNNNPADIIADHEFRLANPGITSGNTTLGEADSLADVPIVPAGPSDMTYEMTRWIAASRDARRFLAGIPDPSGMHVNRYYRRVRYPAETFVPRDPRPQLAHAYAPVFPLARAASDMVEAWPPGTSYPRHVCPPGQRRSFCRLGQEEPGDRVLFGVLDDADTSADLIPSAAIGNPAGRFVTPTPASMAAALRSMVTAPNGITQQVSTTSKDPAEYPLTMVIYAMVPTRGIGSAKAASIARWLRFVAGPGQGGLPSGYLPLTARLRALTRRAARAVQHQTGVTALGRAR